MRSRSPGFIDTPLCKILVHTVYTLYATYLTGRGVGISWETPAVGRFQPQHRNGHTHVRVLNSTIREGSFAPSPSDKWSNCTSCK